MCAGIHIAPAAKSSQICVPPSCATIRVLLNPLESKVFRSIFTYVASEGDSFQMPEKSVSVSVTQHIGSTLESHWNHRQTYVHKLSSK
jgi:hypothetical protein